MIFAYGYIKATTIGELENVPNHQFYVDLNLHEYVFFSNVITSGDEPFPVLLGFLCKNRALLAEEITMKVTLYGFNSETIATQIKYENGIIIQAEDSTKIAIDTNWIYEIDEAVNKRKFDN